MGSRVVTPDGIFVTGDYFAAGRYDPINKQYSRDPLAIEGRKLEVIRDRKTDKVRIAGNELSNCSCNVLDISWLKSCSDVYHISANIEDYVIVEVPCVVATYPNRNLDAFPQDELVSWRVPMSRMAYQTFIGKPVHQDHDNQDPTKAKGVILDAVLTPVLGKMHVKLLKAFDRSKDSRLAKLVQTRNRIGHSMGSLVERVQCSLPWCGYISNGTSTCSHVNNGEGKGQIINGHLVYEDMLDFYFIESSSVEDPAYVVALSDSQHVW